MSDLTGRFRMKDMRWKALDRAIATPTGHGTSWEGLSLKHRAQLTFSSWNKVKAFGKLDAANHAQVHHSFVRARRKPLRDHADPPNGVFTTFNSPYSCSSDLRTTNIKT